MLDGAAVHRLPGGGCVLLRGSTAHVLEGVSFALLKRSIACCLRGDDAAMQGWFARAGYAPEDALQLAGLLAGLGDAGTGAERLLSDRALARWITRHTGAAVSVCFRPPADGEAGAAGEAMLLVGPAGWWVGPRAGACVECARLAFMEAWFPAGAIDASLGGALGATTHCARVLSHDTLARMLTAVRALDATVTIDATAHPTTHPTAHPTAPGWFRCGFDGAPATFAAVRHPACGTCHPTLFARRRPLPRLSPPAVALPTSEAAAVAAHALARLQVHATETIERPHGVSTWRELPIVTVTWRRAYRDPAGDIALHAGTQIGGGPTLAQRLLTARAETVERLLVATRPPDLRGRPYTSLRGVDPGAWGLFAPAQYAARGFPYRPIGPDEPLDWVHARDLAARRWTVLPLDLVNGGAGEHLPASSTGAAAHTSVDGIVTNGLLEILEREALQLAWYRGDAPAIVPRRWLRGVAAEQLAWLKARRWRVHLRVVPGRAGRHVACAIAELTTEKPGLRRHGSLFTSAANGGLGRAVERAVGELVTAVEVLEAQPPLQDTDADAIATADLHAAWHDDDPARIQRLYLAPAMRPALEFFLGGRALAERPPDRTDRAEELVGALIAEGLRPLYVDCTTRGAAPFRAGKTILAGALPHSFATGLVRVGAGPFAPPRRPRALPPPGYRPAPGETTGYPFPLG